MDLLRGQSQITMLWELSSWVLSFKLPLCSRHRENLFPGDTYQCWKPASLTLWSSLNGGLKWFLVFFLVNHSSGSCCIFQVFPLFLSNFIMIIGNIYWALFTCIALFFFVRSISIKSSQQPISVIIPLYSWGNSGKVLKDP